MTVFAEILVLAALLAARKVQKDRASVRLMFKCMGAVPYDADR
jgi:hypothetical protein